MFSSELKAAFQGIVLSSLIMGATVGHTDIEYIFENGIGGYEGTFDTTFQTGAPLNIRGDQGRFETDSSDAGGQNFAMIRFEDIFGTNPGQVPPDATIISAFLTLEVVGNGSSGAEMFELLQPFDEEGDFFTFGDGSGAEPLFGADHEADPVVTLLAPDGSGTISAGNILELDVTSSIVKYQGGAENLGWIIRPGGGDGLEFSSSEASSGRPRLTVITEGIAPVATRSIMPTRYIDGDVLNVSLEVTLEGAGADVTVVETLPERWSASNISNGGSFANGEVTWNLTGFTGTSTLTYNITAPSDSQPSIEIAGILDDQFFTTGDSRAVFSPPFNPIGEVNVAPGEVVVIQVENGTPKTDSPNFLLEGDDSVPSGIVVRSLIDGRVDPFRDEDDLQFFVNIEQAGTYYLFGNFSSTSGSDDSFFVGIDDEAFNDNFFRFNLGPDDGTFHRQYVTSEALNNEIVDYPLDAGSHVINLHTREPGARADWIGITDNIDLDLSTVEEPEPVSVENWPIF